MKTAQHSGPVAVQPPSFISSSSLWVLAQQEPRTTQTLTQVTRGVSHQTTCKTPNHRYAERWRGEGLQHRLAYGNACRLHFTMPVEILRDSAARMLFPGSRRRSMGRWVEHFTWEGYLMPCLVCVPVCIALSWRPRHGQGPLKGKRPWEAQVQAFLSRLGLSAASQCSTESYCPSIRSACGLQESHLPYPTSPRSVCTFLAPVRAAF